jgi:acetyltransferase
MSDLSALIHPKSVAVIGASKTPGKIGYAVIENVKASGYTGEVYPINPREQEIAGYRAYPSILEVGMPVDVAVFCIPAAVSIQVADECGRAGVKHLIVITAGYKEIGPEGRELENKMVQVARQYGMRITGPNNLGIMDTHTPINATFARNFPFKGNVAFISQSGALCVAILDWSLKHGLGFSQFISVGNKADLNEADFIEAAADDPNTKVVCLYLEDVVDGDRFIEAARAATQKVPVIVLKSGITAAGAKAASSHTGALAGSNTAYDAALRHAGVIRASTMTELFDLAIAFTTQPIPKGKNTVVVTNSGGPGIVASDAVETNGLNMARLTEASIEELRAKLPPTANIHNPIDVVGDAHADRYQIALDTALNDPQVDAAVVLLSPTAVLDIREAAVITANANLAHPDKAIVASFMGGAAVEVGVKYLSDHGIPAYPFPEPAIATLRGMIRYGELRQEVARSREWTFSDVKKDKVKAIFDRVRADGRDLLLGPEAAEVAGLYKILAAPSRLARDEKEAVAFAGSIGYPVVLKVASPDIMHKTDVGGVKVGLSSPEEVVEAFASIMQSSRKAIPSANIHGVEVQKMMPKGDELIVGMAKDPTFGPIIAFGSGGVLVNLLKDASFRLAKGLSRDEVAEMISETKAHTILKGFRGAEPDDIPALEEAIGRVGQLCRDFPEIAEMDVNPVFAYPKGLSALDVKIKLQ